MAGLASALVATAITALEPSAQPSTLALGDGPPTSACVQVGEYLTEWQRRLELRDWSVGYYCTPDPELGDTADGSNLLFSEERIAVVHIHPKASDPEETVAHELAHIWLAYVREADSELVEEQAVRIFTRLLVAGKRCTPKVVTP